MTATGAHTRFDADRPSLPARLQVEVTAACNLRCRMCPVRYRPPVNRVTGSMPLATFMALLDDNPEITDVTLQGLGRAAAGSRPAGARCIAECSDRSAGCTFAQRSATRVCEGPPAS